jgi:hypothetical protein
MHILKAYVICSLRLFTYYYVHGNMEQEVARNIIGLGMRQIEWPIAIFEGKKSVWRAI